MEQENVISFSPTVIGLSVIACGCVVGAVAPLSSDRDASGQGGTRMRHESDAPHQADQCDSWARRAEGLEREVARIRRRYEVIDKRLAETASTQARWPADLADEFRPSGFERTLRAVATSHGVEELTIDCHEFPCIAQLPRSATEEQFQSIYAELKRSHPEEVETYAYKSFYGQASVGPSPAVYSFSLFLRELVSDEVMNRLQDRAHAHAAAAKADASEPEDGEP